ncbi:MAG: preprotein translocase subunit SecE [Phycisphaerales bacterium]
MGIGVYKPGQGYWTRMMSAIGAGLVVGAGVAYVWEQLEKVDVTFERVYLQGGVAAGLVLIFAALIYRFIYAAPKTSDFLIATEGEMKKVNWSTRREIIGSTWVVIAVAFGIALILFVVDIGFSEFFRWVGLLEVS